MDGLLAIVMAGGIGERLQPLTRDRAKAAVPFGGKFRLIDFTLSNCINSGVRQIYILTQYRSDSLNRHIQNGWSISSAGLGLILLHPVAQQKLGTEWYHARRMQYARISTWSNRRTWITLIILSGDHIYKMNYLQLLNYHRSKNASLTVAAVRVKKEDAAGKLGVMEIDQDSRLIGFQEKPLEPKTISEAPDYALASMGVYMFRTGTLLKAMEGNEDDFGKDVIPGMRG